MVNNILIYFCLNIQKWLTNIIKKNKDKLQKEARERYQNLSEEEKEKNRQYHWSTN